MNGVTRYLAVGRSLGTGALIGVARRHPGRMDPLDLSWLEEPLAALPGDRAREVDGLISAATISDLQEHMAAGELTAEELALHLLRRVRAREPGLCSLIDLNPAVLAEARSADARRAAGEPSGPLHGIPVTIKDNIETAGQMRTTGGAEILAGHVATSDAPVVTALRAAGAVVLGKANLSELAGAVVRTPGFSAVGGKSVNPYGDTFTPGGSSSGSAVSVAAGLAIASVGTETSGSLIAPAAFNGLVGMKPSLGVVDGHGVIPLVRHQDSPGPIGRTVADVALLLQAMAVRPIAVDLSPGALDGVRMGILADDIRTQRSPYEDCSDNGDLLDRIEAGMRAAGATTVDTSLVSDIPLAQYESGFLTVVLGGLSHDTIGWLADAGAPVASVSDLHAYNLQRPRRRMPSGQFFLDLAVVRRIGREAYDEAALQHRGLAQRILDASFDAAGTDVLVSLTNRHSSLYATAGYPAVTVPLGPRANGMPTGATLIGRPDQDGPLLGIAHAFERATRLRVPPVGT